MRCRSRYPIQQKKTIETIESNAKLTDGIDPDNRAGFRVRRQPAHGGSPRFRSFAVGSQIVRGLFLNRFQIHVMLHGAAIEEQFRIWNKRAMEKKEQERINLAMNWNNLVGTGTKKLFMIKCHMHTTTRTSRRSTENKISTPSLSYYTRPPLFLRTIKQKPRVPVLFQIKPIEREKAYRFRRLK